MAIGDTKDTTNRLWALLPFSWFSKAATPFLSSLLAAPAAALSWLFSLYAYAKLQTRIATATDGFLDLIAQDYFGIALVRSLGQTDTAFRARILAGLFPQRVTRGAIVSILTTLTGYVPRVIELQNPGDIGGYRMPNCGYGVAGAYGSKVMPFQVFVTAYRPPISGVPLVAGYRSTIGGYGVGGIEYTTRANVTGPTDANIVAAIESVRPAAVTVWTQISNKLNPQPVAINNGIISLGTGPILIL
jgi:hypothetical protein